MLANFSNTEGDTTSSARTGGQGSTRGAITLNDGPSLLKLVIAGVLTAGALYYGRKLIKHLKK